MGSCLMSMSTNVLTSCWRCSMYDEIIWSSFFWTDLERFAKPYPGRSTKYHSLFIMKWLMSRVLPGVAEVLASPLWLQSMLMRLDLPTFERPMKAYSALLSLGHWLMLADDMENSDFFIIMILALFCFDKVLQSYEFNFEIRLLTAQLPRFCLFASVSRWRVCFR